MPLSELLYRVAKGKLDSSQHQDPSCSSALSLPPENDVAELVWENGQVLPSRGRKVEACNNLLSRSPRSRGRDIAAGTSLKFGGKYGPMEPLLPQGPMPPEIDLDQDDDLVPWLNYPIEDNLQHDYCSELSGVTMTGNSSHNNLASSYTSSSDRYVGIQYGDRLEQGRFCSTVDSVRPAAGPVHSQLCPASFPCFRSRDSSDSCDKMHLASAIHRPVTEDSNLVLASRGGFPAVKSQGQVLAASTTGENFLNFSHFSRPVASDKANPDGISVRIGPTSSSLERAPTSGPGSIPSTGNHAESSLIDSCSGTISHSHPAKSSEVNPVLLEKKPAEETVPRELPEPVSREDDCKISKNCGGSGAKGMEDGGKSVEPVNASSVCSGNSVGRASDDTGQNKRKQRDNEDCEGPSEDAEEESVGAKRTTPARGGSGAKRSRAAEVHNLSERRRRDRINEKMRALQELIPNCNKVDKASMLDEAIDYLKALQLQVQIMSMGAGVYMPAMVLPPGMSHMHAAHMARFANVGAGMGMGIGFGMGMPDVNGGPSGCPVLRVPGAHFSSPPVGGLGFGIPAQGLAMPYPRLPVMPVSGGPVLMGAHAHGVPGPLDGQDVAASFAPREDIPDVPPQVTQQNGAGSCADPTSSKRQAAKGCHQQSALVESEHQPSQVANDQASQCG